jgi:hypothetical protein
MRPRRQCRGLRYWRARRRSAVSRAGCRSPPTVRPPGVDVVVRGCRRGCFGFRCFARDPPPVRPLPIECQPPRHPRQPGSETASIAELREASKRLCKRLLGHILGVLPVSEHAVREPERQRRRVGQPRFEFPLEVVIHVWSGAGDPVDVPSHSRPESKTPLAAQRLGWAYRVVVSYRVAVQYVGAGFSRPPAVNPLCSGILGSSCLP